MKQISLSRQGPVWILRLSTNESAGGLDDDDLVALDAALDTVEAGSDNAALIVHGENPHTWCNGIDLPWLMTQDEVAHRRFISHLEELLLRLSLCNLATIACLHGDCYAAGALLAFACDFRLMREDRARLCLSQVKLKMPYTPAMLAVLHQAAPAQAIWGMALTAHACLGAEALRLQLVDRIHPADRLFHHCLEFAEQMAQRHRATYSEIKHGLRAETRALWQRRRHGLETS